MLVHDPLTVVGGGKVDRAVNIRGIPELAKGARQARESGCIEEKEVKVSVRCGDLGEIAIGSTWRSAIANSPTPTLRAASTWSQRLIESTGARTTRAIAGV